MSTKDTLIKCSACGKNMVFSPEKQTLVCSHCGANMIIPDKGLAVNLPLSSLESINSWQSETHVYKCSSCGASSVLSSTEIANECSFCGTAHIATTSSLSGLRPNGIVPFKLTVDNASSIAKAKFSKGFFKPDAFKKSVKPEGVKGIYNPVFSFNADTFTIYKGILEEDYTDSDGDSHSRSFRIGGNYARNFEDLLIEASDHVDQKTVDKISPFNMTGCLAYNKYYLLGFSASQHTISGPEAWKNATATMDEKIENEILKKYSYDHVLSFKADTTINSASFKYCLLPIYVGHCTYKDKLYNFYVNGENGKIAGKTPISVIKIMLTIFFPIGFVVLLFKGIGRLFAAIFRKRPKIKKEKKPNNNKPS